LDLPNTTAISLDVTSTLALDAQVALHDVVISLIPYSHHTAVIKSAIKGKTNVVTASYVSPELKALDAEAKNAGIIVINEIGLNPGIDHLYAIKTISEVHEKGGKVSYHYFFSLLSPFNIGYVLDQAILIVLWWFTRT
jgi:saccharopine dehydrogenase-like NADP-dependent oxidoreductase